MKRPPILSENRGDEDARVAEALTRASDAAATSEACAWKHDQPVIRLQAIGHRDVRSSLMLSMCLIPRALASAMTDRLMICMSSPFIEKMTVIISSLGTSFHDA